MLTKNEFVEIIGRLQEATDLQDNIDKLMKQAKDNIMNDYLNAGALMINHEDIVIDLLGKLMCDSKEDINWWIYGTNYGRDKDENTIYVNEKDVRIDTAEELYDFILKYNNDRQVEQQWK